MSLLNPLLDKEFLQKLDNFPTREVYAKVVALDLQDNPIEEITGRVTQGSINVDGSSAVRRTCNLTLNATEVNLSDFYWGFKTKIKLEIGLKNFVDPKYSDIIWFKQGIYYITSFSCSQSTNSYSITINGKDKMCMLNGEMGGLLPASTDFGVKNVYNEETGETEVIDLLVYDIIKEAVHFYGKEPYYNIIINDLDTYGLWVLKYGSEEPMYLIKKHFLNSRANKSHKVIMNQNKVCQEVEIQNGQIVKTNNTYSLRNLPEYDVLSSENLIDYNIEKGTKFIFSNDLTDYYFTAVKIEYGENIGYDITELTYPDAKNLTLNAGETITSLLDKISSTFGDFEYFYDLDGRFVFQKKKTYLNTSWNNLSYIDDKVFADSAANTSACSYYFENSNLITSFSNSPNFAEVKNDFIVWGERTSPDSNSQIPIHMRYALDKKPQFYHSITVGQDEIVGLDTVKKTQVGHGYFTQEFLNLIQKEVREGRLNSEEDLIEIKEEIDNYIIDLNNSILKIENNLSDYLKADYLNNDNSEQFIGLEEILENLQEFNKIVDLYICQLTSFEADGNTLHSLLDRFEKFKMSLENTEYFSNSDYLSLAKQIINEFKTAITLTEPVDWRELIYQMAVDYYAFGTLDDFVIKIKESNYRKVGDGEQSETESGSYYLYTPYSFYNNGYTSYEQYYLDLNGFWRQLYNYTPEKEFKEIELKEQTELFVKGAYCPVTNKSLENMTYEEKKQIVVLKQNQIETNVIEDECLEYCFIPLIDLIPLQFIDEETGQVKKNLYYLYENEKYKAITNVSNYNKLDLYIKKDKKYYSLLDYYLQPEYASSFTSGQTDWIEKIADTQNIIQSNDLKIENGYQNIREFYWAIRGKEPDEGLEGLGYKYNNTYISNLENMITETNEKMTQDSIITQILFGWVVDNCWSKTQNLQKKKLTRKFNWEIDFSSLELTEIKASINQVYQKNLKLLNKTKNQINNSITGLEKTKEAIKSKIKSLPTSSKELKAWKKLLNIVDKELIENLKDYRSKLIKNYVNQLNEYKNSLMDSYNINKSIINKAKKSNSIQKNNIKEYQAYKNNTALFDNYVSIIFEKGTEPLELYIYDNKNIGFIDPKIYYSSNDKIRNMYYKNGEYQNKIKSYSYNKFVTDFIRYTNDLGQKIRSINFSDIQYYDLIQNYYSSQEEYPYWNYNVDKAPDNLNFWIDFLDTDSQAGLNQYSVQVIGDRAKVDNNSKVVSIYYKDIPEILFLTQNSALSKIDMPGYEKIYVTDKQKELFLISSVGITAKEQVDNLLYNYGYCAEAIALNTLPIYYLEPNTRISVKDEKTGIEGEYIMTKFTLPLTHNGTSSITATKAPKRIT